jgi:hypothetical protein
MELNVYLIATDGELLEDATHYRHIVESLVYLGATRLDISYSVHILSQFVSYLQSFSWQISSKRLRLASTISFISSSLVFLIQHEFEGGIRCILIFSIIVFLHRILCIFYSLCVYIYIFGSRVLISIQVLFLFITVIMVGYQK